MTDPWTWLAPIIGGGGTLAAIAAILVYVTRDAIAKAVAQAGAREIERLRGQLASELERERQTFAREVERERQAFARESEQERQSAARTLEQFKAELTLEAEVRRQTAAKKVAALLRLSDATITLMRVFHGDKGESHAKRCYDAGIAWSHVEVEIEVLLGPQALAELMAFRGAVTEVTTAFTTLELGSTPPAEAAIARLDAEGRLDGARLRLFELLRHELQILAEERGQTGHAKGAK